RVQPIRRHLRLVPLIVAISWRHASPDRPFYARRRRYSAVVTRTQETAMPEIYVHAVKGRTQEQKRALVKDITDAVVKNFSVPTDAVVVEIVETEPTLKAKGGVLFSERR